MKPNLYILKNVKTEEVIAFTSSCAPFEISPLTNVGAVFDWLNGKWQVEEIMIDNKGKYVYE
jgi:hypothetical protein